MCDTEKKASAVDGELQQIFERENEIFTWSKAAAFCIYGTLNDAARNDREELLALALATAEFCIENEKTLDHYHRLLYRAGFPRPRSG